MIPFHPSRGLNSPHVITDVRGDEPGAQTGNSLEQTLLSPALEPQPLATVGTLSRLLHPKWSSSAVSQPAGTWKQL